MKHYILSAILIATVLCVGNDSYAQVKNSDKESITASIKKKSLQLKRENLIKEIKAQDAKRNKQMSGVSAETNEAINDSQDSICLALRSQLVDVILEIKEVSSEVSSPFLLQQFNILVNQNEGKTDNKSKSK